MELLVKEAKLDQFMSQGTGLPVFSFRPEKLLSPSRNRAPGARFLKVLIIKYTQIHTLRVVVVHDGGGGEASWNPSPEFLTCCSISKRFCLQWKAFDLLNKMRYIIWVMALLEACDVTNNGRHLGFYQELEIRLKPREMVFFLCFT